MPRNHPKRKSRTVPRTGDRTFQELAPYSGLAFERKDGSSLVNSRSARETATALHVAFGRGVTKGQVDLAFAELMTAGATLANEHDEYTMITFWAEVKQSVDWAKDMSSLSVFQLAFLLIDGRRRWRTTSRAKYEKLFGQAVPAVDHFLDMMEKHHSNNMLLSLGYQEKNVAFGDDDYGDEDEDEDEDEDDEMANKKGQTTAPAVNHDNSKKRRDQEVEDMVATVGIDDEADYFDLDEAGPIGSEQRQAWVATKRRRRWGAPWVPTRDELLAEETAKVNLEG